MAEMWSNSKRAGKPFAAKEYGFDYADSIIGEFTWSRLIHGPAFGQCMWSGNSSFGVSQKETLWHWSCPIWIDPTIYLKMQMMFTNDIKRRWAKSFEFICHSMLWADDGSKCWVWFMVGKDNWVYVVGRQHWERRWITILIRSFVLREKKRTNGRRNLFDINWTAICCQKLTWTVMYIIECFEDHSKQRRDYSKREKWIDDL